jgi:hypothetical protein
MFLIVAMGLSEYRPMRGHETYMVDTSIFSFTEMQVMHCTTIRKNEDIAAPAYPEMGTSEASQDFH